MLRSLNPCKSTGIDKIPAKIIRIAAPVIAESLTKIFNAAIFSETVPFDWKVARVIPSRKSGSRNLFNNYRPVSILSAISKVFEKLLYEQLYGYFVSNNLLSDRQFGFRQFHSTASISPVVSGPDSLFFFDFLALSANRAIQAHTRTTFQN